MVEGQRDVEHTPRREGGALLDRLHPGNRPPSAPVRGVPGRKAQHITLLGYGLPPRSRFYQALALPRKVEALPAESPKDPRRSRPPVRGSFRVHPQTTSAEAAPPGVDLARDLVHYQ